MNRKMSSRKAIKWLTMLSTSLEIVQYHVCPQSIYYLKKQTKSYIHLFLKCYSQFTAACFIPWCEWGGAAGVSWGKPGLAQTRTSARSCCIVTSTPSVTVGSSYWQWCSSTQHFLCSRHKSLVNRGQTEADKCLIRCLRNCWVTTTTNLSYYLSVLTDRRRQIWDGPGFVKGWGLKVWGWGQSDCCVLKRPQVLISLKWWTVNEKLFGGRF